MTLTNWEADLDRRAEERAAWAAAEHQAVRKRVFVAFVALGVIATVLILGCCA